MKNNTGLRAVAPDSAGKTARIPPRKRTFRLTNARAVRRELAVVYAELRNGELCVEDAKAAAHVLRCIAECLRLDEFESRLDELEESAR
jgi:hypothetical protein